MVSVLASGQPIVTDIGRKAKRCISSPSTASAAMTTR